MIYLKKAARSSEAGHEELRAVVEKILGKMARDGASAARAVASTVKHGPQNQFGRDSLQHRAAESVSRLRQLWAFGFEFRGC